MNRIPGEHLKNTEEQFLSNPNLSTDINKTAFDMFKLYMDAKAVDQVPVRESQETKENQMETD